MDIKEALDFLASNCPTVFQPISSEITNLRNTNDNMKKDLEDTQKALNELIFSTLNGGM